MKTDVEETIRNLRRNNMEGYYVEGKEELHNLLSTLIDDNTSVGSGDSVTLEETEVFDYLRKRELVFLDKHDKALTSAQKKELYLKNFTVDTFITGTNALTKDGQLFNIDGNGSRVAPMIYGPDQVIVVVGVNKLVGTLKEAIYRTRQIAAPMDAKRLLKETPCTKLDRCIDCRHKQRICNDFVLISGQFIKDRIKVIIVNESLGF